MKEIPLRNTDKVAIVDDNVFNMVGWLNWRINQNGYVITDIPKPRRKDIGKTTIRLHRLVMNTPEGMDTDHINGNRLDNRKVNLRVCSRSDNLFNQGSGGSSKHSNLKGAYLRKNTGRWFSTIRCPSTKKEIYLGSFDSAEEAHQAYKAKSLELHKEFSYFYGGKNEN